VTDPITPPPELVQQWWKSTPVQILATDPDPIQLIATRAAQWGADQELEACCLLLDSPDGTSLRNARRQPPTLKEEALEQLDGIATAFRMTHGGNIVCDKILAALKALPE
jgi:hypothetical protein